MKCDATNLVIRKRWLLTFL